MKSNATLLSGLQHPRQSIPAFTSSNSEPVATTASVAPSILSKSQCIQPAAVGASSQCIQPVNPSAASCQNHSQNSNHLFSHPSNSRSGQPLSAQEAAGGKAGGATSNATVPQRLVTLMGYNKQRLLQELRAHQLVSDDEEEGASTRRRFCPKKPTRGPLSEGNRPRRIWALEEVQVLELEILGVAGLNLFDEHGDLKVDPRTHEPHKKLQGRYAEDARDLIEALLRANHADNPFVQRLEKEAGSQVHILNSETVRRQLIRLMDRLLQHMEALKMVSAGTLLLIELRRCRMTSSRERGL